MDCLLDKQITFKKQPEERSLYSWSLVETKEGKAPSSDQIPWPWTAHFTCSSLRVMRGVTIKGPRESFIDFGGDTVEAKDTEVTESLSIRGDLFSGAQWGDEFDKCARYSMFGTDRTFNKFDLTIQGVPDGTKEGCYLWGTPSYEYENDFRTHLEDDTVVVNVLLGMTRFNEFVRVIEAKQVDNASVQLGGVSGFYSDWSPSISTSEIKVLTSEQVVEGLEGSEIQPHILGKVTKFGITLNTVNGLKAMMGSLGDKEFYKQLEEPEELVENSGLLSTIGFRQDPVPDSLSKEQQFAFYAKLLNGFKLPLWLIFIALVLILVK